jgi:hypothetical protein
MNGYKGFDKDLKCRDKQFEIGKTYEEKEAKLCSKGLHFVEYPLDTFGYYPPSDSRYAEVEAEDVSDEKDSDSKRVRKKLTIKSELSIKGIIGASVKFILEKIDWENKKEANTGNQSAATNTGYQSAATNTGYQSAAIVKGKDSIAFSMGIEGKASGALGCWIVLAEWKQDKKGNWKIKSVKSARVDGKRIKPDTFYILKDGKFMEGEAAQ